MILSKLYFIDNLLAIVSQSDDRANHQKKSIIPKHGLNLGPFARKFPALLTELTGIQFQM